MADGWNPTLELRIVKRTTSDRLYFALVHQQRWEKAVTKDHMLERFDYEWRDIPIVEKE